MSVQLDLFGQVEAKESAAEKRRAHADAFRRRATTNPDGTPVTWTAPTDTVGGMKAGDTTVGWRCWSCGTVEVNDCVLNLNHGLSAHDPHVLERTACFNTPDRGYSRESWALHRTEVNR